jgi:hypothetical protein
LAELPGNPATDWRRVQLTRGKFSSSATPNNRSTPFAADIEAYLDVVDKIIKARTASSAV